MPFSVAWEEKTITVQAVELSIEADRRLALPGQTVQFTCTLTGAGEGYRVSVIDTGAAASVGSAYTDRNGVAIIRWTVPWELSRIKLPCTDREFYADCPDLGVSSGIVRVAIAHPVEIHDFRVYPTTVPPGGSVEVEGYLEYEYPEGAWNGLGGRSLDVSLIGPGGVVWGTTTSTDRDTGYFGFVFPAPSEPGTYTLRVRFDGEGFPTYSKAMYHYAPAEVEAGIAVGKPKPSLAPLIAGIGAVVGTAGMAYIAKRRR